MNSLIAKAKKFATSFLFNQTPRVVQLVVVHFKSRFNLKKLRRAQSAMFPATTDGYMALHKPTREGRNGEQYFTQLYEMSKAVLTSVSPYEAFLNKVETIAAVPYPKGEKIKIELNHDSILPISIINKSGDIVDIDQNMITASRENNEECLRLFIPQNRFLYTPFQKGSYTIKSTHPLLLGSPISKRDTSPSPQKKLVLTIFLDSLASEVFKDSNLAELMPHTNKYFSSGLTTYNCCANGNWTLPSVPSIMTGKYPANHGASNPNISPDLPSKSKMLAEYFKENGYFTYSINSNHHVNPISGYNVGFDRFILAREENCKFVIDDTIETLKAFPERSTFGFISIMELHHVIEHCPSLSVLTRTHEPFYKYQKMDLPKEYHNAQTSRYMAEMKRVDFYLERLYRYISENYNDDEIVIALVSDHGKEFLNCNYAKYPLNEAKIRVPFFLKGSKVTGDISDFCMENIDILPTILDSCSITDNIPEIDGQLPEPFGGQAKHFAYSEVRYPGKPFEASLRNKDYMIRYKSNGNIDEHGNFDSDKYSIYLEDFYGNKIEGQTDLMLSLEKEILNKIVPSTTS